MKLAPLVTPAQAGMLDAYMIHQLEIPGIVLMEEAARALFDAVTRLQKQPCRVLCVAGSGNNGGDAWAVGRILLAHGYDVQMGATSLDLPGDARINSLFWQHFPGRVTLLSEHSLPEFFSRSADVIVDGLLGTGLTRPASGFYGRIISAINAHPAKVVSVDIPSGTFGDTGAGDLAVFADETVTFQYAKPGHFLYPGRTHTGRLTVAKIGVDDGAPPPSLFLLEDVSLPPRDPSANKGSFGRLAIMAGSQGMAGAAVLTARGALAAGAGLTTGLVCPFVQQVLQAAVPPVTARAVTACTTHLDGQVSFGDLSGFSALAIGPGLGLHKSFLPVLSEICASNLPKVIDADALNLLAGSGAPYHFGKNTVLTPHPKEFSRLSGLSMAQVLADPVSAARGFAQKHGVTLLLKGATTVVAHKGDACLIPFGSPSMAKGGSGDVLTGVIGALLAQGYPPYEAAVTGSGLCGKAGQLAAAQLGEYAPTAEDTIRLLGAAGRS
ncbi:MAG: NAD(P)H-hydrate dehydratase [Christensenellaceae bacterium]|nr:NAD(P)H-hydrate dehydratase [Christensenellaceae bacterium]